MRETVPLLALLVLLPAMVLFGGQAAQIEHPAELLQHRFPVFDSGHHQTKCINRVSNIRQRMP